MLRIVCFILLVILLVACNVNRVLNPTLRERYAKKFAGPDSLRDAWNNAYIYARQHALPVTLPFSFSAHLPGGRQAISYFFVVPQGQQLMVELRRPADSSQFFVELFRKGTADNTRPLQEMEMTNPLLQQAVEMTDTFQLIVQSAIYTREPVAVRLYAQPAYLFPVAGKGNAAMTSFWGAARDGGSRNHEGIDIFAAKGTPLLAVANGRINSTGNRGLGGKQVWLREKVTGMSVYYAHLDSILVQPRDEVKKGDTVGLVGNTGNAATTSPHLHFGVYGSNGAVDPLHYIKQLPVPAFREPAIAVIKLTRNTKNELRAGPGSSFSVLQVLDKNDSLLLISQSPGWYHVETRSRVQGFITESSVK